MPDKPKNPYAVSADPKATTDYIMFEQAAFIVLGRIAGLSHKEIGEVLKKAMIGSLQEFKAKVIEEVLEQQKQTADTLGSLLGRKG